MKYIVEDIFRYEISDFVLGKLDFDQRLFLRIRNNEHEAIKYQICSNICYFYSLIQSEGKEEEFNKFLGFKFKILDTLPFSFTEDNCYELDASFSENNIFSFLQMNEKDKR